jgi:muramoyltetrapeptide carboxypeptidase
MFQNEEVKAIFCARGGYGTLRFLDKIDFGLIKKNPKVFVGYSDITALLLTLFRKTGLITFHGPVVRDLSRERSGNLKAFFNLVSLGKRLKLDLSEGRPLIYGKADGPLLGGNLSLISSLVGTPYIPSFRGALLFIEERGEPIYRLDRMLTQLKLSGVLSHIHGLLIGGFEDCGDRSTINHLILDRVHDLNIPVVSGVPVGHGLDNRPLPIGLQGTFDTETMTLTFAESSVTP